MKPIQPSVEIFGRQGHFTQMDDLAFDVLMPRLSGAAWKVLCLIVRKTRGWNKKSDAISYSQIKAGTGIKSDTTIRAALKDLLALDKQGQPTSLSIILKRDGASQFDATRYALNRKFSLPVAPHLLPRDEEEIDPFEGENPAPKSEVGTSKNGAMPTPKNGAVTTPKNEVAPASKNGETINRDKQEKQIKGGCEGVSSAHNTSKSPPTRPPEPVSKSAFELLPDPSSSPELQALKDVCHATPRSSKDRQNWPDAVATVREEMPDAAPEERAEAVREFDRRWREGGKRGSPYLGNVTAHFARVMNGAINGHKSDTALEGEDEALAAKKRAMDRAYDPTLGGRAT